MFDDGKKLRDEGATGKAKAEAQDAHKKFEGEDLMEYKCISCEHKYSTPFTPTDCPKCGSGVQQTRAFEGAGEVITPREPSDEEVMAETMAGAVDDLKASIDGLIKAFETEIRGDIKRIVKGLEALVKITARPPTKKSSECCNAMVVRKLSGLTHCYMCGEICKVKEILL